MNVIQDVLVALFAVLSTALAVLLGVLQERALQDDILGPMGALAFTVIALGVLLKYISTIQKEARADRERLLKEKDKQIDKLASRVEHLERELGRGP